MKRVILILAVALVLACAAGASARTDHAQAPTKTTEIGYPHPLMLYGRNWLNTYWKYVFGNSGQTYTSPKYIWWYDKPGREGKYIETKCDSDWKYDGQQYAGPARWYHLRPNSYYCPVDSSLYLDYGLFADLIKIDDANALVILAHEWGHHIQHLLVWPYSKKYDKKAAQRELMADCFAGAFFKYLSRNNQLDDNDVAHAEQALVNFGDPDKYPWDGRGAHGDKKDRAKWFLYGYDHNPQDCGKLFIVTQP